MNARSTLPVVALAMLLLAPSAAAHTRFHVGEYTAVVGWDVEPPIADEPNAVALRLLAPADAHDHDHDHESGDHHGSASTVPVTGQAQNLSVTLRIGGRETTLSFRESHGNPGYYVAGLIPTVPGVYNATFSGSANNETVDFSLNLQEVVPPSAQAFPEETSTAYEMQREIDRLAERVDALEAELATQADTPADVTPATGEGRANPIPFPAALGLAVVALAAFVLRRRN